MNGGRNGHFLHIALGKSVFPDGADRKPLDLIGNDNAGIGADILGDYYGIFSDFICKITGRICMRTAADTRDYKDGEQKKGE